MLLDLAGQLNSINLAESKALWPLFEAIVNSIQAIEDSPNKDRGRITIMAEREPSMQTQVKQDQKELLEKFESFTVIDNGIGFNDTNYHSFRTAYSTLKVKKGCKGIGRFLWLKAFEEVEIHSTFFENGSFFSRDFSFDSEHGITPEENNVTISGEKESRTSVKLKNFLPKYRNKAPVELDAVAKKIIEHCLPFFISGVCPQIIIQDGISSPINLNQYFEANIKDSLHQDHFSIKESDFTIYHVRLPEGADAHVHYVRQLCDEVFGRNNECATIVWKKGTPTAKIIRNSFNYLLWYAKDAEKVGNKVHKLYTERSGIEGSTEDPKKLALWGDFEHGETRPLTTDEKRAILATSQIANIFRVDKAIERGDDPERKFSISLDGTCFTPKEGYVWRGKYDQIQRLIEKNRLIKTNEGYEYKFYISDFPAIEITNLWEDTAGKVPNMIYAVQTNEKIIQRCMLITTDPGDLVLDITCGSGTTAFVAEQWGRRWITCDTSRVAIAIAKQRLMTATFDYYKLAHEEQGVGSGFVYKTVPHITLKSIANNEPPANEILYDQPEIDKGKVRITGPFTVEALPAPVVKPLDDIGDIEEDFSAKQTDWRDQLLATGVLGRGGSRLTFSRVEPLSGTKFLQAEAETKEDLPRRAVICFAGETKPLDSRMVAMAMDEVERLRPAPKLVIFAAFQFDPEAAKDIDEYIYPGVTVLKAQMNTDLMTEDLKKERSSDQSFWLVGQPDVELIRDGRSKRKFKVKVNGFDYYDVKKGTVESGSTSRIAMWMLDTDYDGMCIEPKQVFFPMGGKKDGWNKLAKTLRAEIDPDLIEKYAGNESLWFMAEPNTRIAVKIIDDRGIESLKVIRIGDE